MYKCKSCGAIDSRKCNGDNSVCTECGTPDDFEEVPSRMELLDELDEIFDVIIASKYSHDGFELTGKDIVHLLKET